MGFGYLERIELQPECLQHNQALRWLNARCVVQRVGRSFQGYKCAWRKDALQGTRHSAESIAVQQQADDRLGRSRSQIARSSLGGLGLDTDNVGGPLPRL